MSGADHGDAAGSAGALEPLDSFRGKNSIIFPSQARYQG